MKKVALIFYIASQCCSIEARLSNIDLAQLIIDQNEEITDNIRRRIAWTSDNLIDLINKRHSDMSNQISCIAKELQNLKTELETKSQEPFDASHQTAASPEELLSLLKNISERLTTINTEISNLKNNITTVRSHLEKNLSAHEDITENRASESLTLSKSNELVLDGHMRQSNDSHEN